MGALVGKLEWHDGDIVSPDATFLTYRKYHEMLVKQIMEEYKCDREDAEMCVRVDRWATKHIIPLVRAGIKPSPAVLKSIAKNCLDGYIRHLQREYLWATGKEDFIPYGYDTKGVKIKDTFRASGPRRKRKSPDSGETKWHAT